MQPNSFSNNSLNNFTKKSVGIKNLTNLELRYVDVSGVNEMEGYSGTQAREKLASILNMMV